MENGVAEEPFAATDSVFAQVPSIAVRVFLFDIV